MKALAWLRGGSKAQELVEVGVEACRADEPKAPGWHKANQGWCSAQDVRAMVRGWQYAYRYKHYPDSLMRDPVTHPTCPECQVLLDQALETTKQGSVPDQLMDATEASYEAYKEREDDRDDDFGFDEPHW